MTKGNFALMQKHYKRPFKCIVKGRELRDVLARYMQWYTQNPDSFVNRLNLKNRYMLADMPTRVSLSHDERMPGTVENYWSGILFVSRWSGFQ